MQPHIELHTGIESFLFEPSEREDAKIHCSYMSFEYHYWLSLSEGFSTWKTTDDLDVIQESAQLHGKQLIFIYLAYTSVSTYLQTFLQWGV